MDDIKVQACARDSLYTVLSRNFHFAVSQRWLIYDYETEFSFVRLIKINEKLIINLCQLDD